MSYFEGIIMDKGEKCVPLQILVFILITGVLSETVEICHLLMYGSCYDQDTIDILINIHLNIIMAEIIFGILWYMIVKMLCESSNSLNKELAWYLGPLLPLVVKVSLKITVPLLHNQC